MSMSHNQRKAKRQPFQLTAFVDLGDSSPPLPCTVTDISESGARISIDGVGAVPVEFSLVMTRNGRLRRHCNVVWRSDAQIGVMFVPTPKTFHEAPMPPIDSVTDDTVGSVEQDVMVKLNS